MTVPVTADWKPAPGPLMTRWAKDVSPEKVHPEYPRPQMVRKDWVNLNGLWDYAIVDWAENLNVYRRPSAPWGKILVPFPIESSLSGVGKRVTAKQILLYARTFRTPKLADGGRLLLHFGAVDWEATVSVNGTKVGEHRGGYDPFTFDITAALKPGDAEQELVVAVHDPTDDSYQPRGKQVANPHGIWYTPVTGIWQTVWLEPVPAKHIERLKVVTDVDTGTVDVYVALAGKADGAFVRISVLDRGNEITWMMGDLPKDKPVRFWLGEAKLWSPDSPHLYDLKVEVYGGNRDSVQSYFAMRKISLDKDEHGDLRLLLNNKPLFQFGPLDQGWWPDGLYTAPTDEALKYDIELTKQLGFNMIRKHVKVEPDRWYYHCDKLGMLVWQDMPSGDQHARWDPLGTHNGTEMTRSEESARNYDAEWKAIIDDLRNHPCIVMWVPFNEGWGQSDTVRVTEWTKKYDPTRLVNCASGGNDFPVGDVYDIHRYPGPPHPADGKRAIVLGEYGGLGLPLEGHTWLAKGNWGIARSRRRRNCSRPTAADRSAPAAGGPGTGRGDLHADDRRGGRDQRPDDVRSGGAQIRRGKARRGTQEAVPAAAENLGRGADVARGTANLARRDGQAGRWLGAAPLRRLGLESSPRRLRREEPPPAASSAPSGKRPTSGSAARSRSPRTKPAAWESPSTTTRTARST
jgi:hypothetical protein